MSEFVNVIEVTYDDVDERGWRDKGSIYAIQTGYKFWNQKTESEPNPSSWVNEGWKINGSNFTVYPDEVDRYIELLQKIKETGKPETFADGGLSVTEREADLQAAISRSSAPEVHYGNLELSGEGNEGEDG